MAVIWRDIKGGGGRIILTGKELKKVEAAARLIGATPRQVLLQALFEMAFREGVINEEEKRKWIRRYCGKFGKMALAFPKD